MAKKFKIDLSNLPDIEEPSEQEQEEHDIEALAQQENDPEWKKFARQVLVDAPVGLFKGLLGVEPDAARKDTSDYFNLAGQFLQSGLPFGAYKSILPKGNVFHGSQKLFDKFDPSKYDTSDTLGWMTHFAENPEYAGKYAMGTHKGEMKVPGGTKPLLSQDLTYSGWTSNKQVNPNIIPANIEAENVLDLVDPNPDDLSAALASLHPANRKYFLDKYKETRRYVRENVEGLDSKGLQNAVLNPTHYKGQDVDPRELPIRDLAENIRLNPEDMNRSPFDAIRYRDQGNKSWAVPEGTPIKSIFGSPLTNDANPLKLIPSHDPTVGGRNELVNNISIPIMESGLKDSNKLNDLFAELQNSLNNIPSPKKYIVLNQKGDLNPYFTTSKKEAIELGSQPGKDWDTVESFKKYNPNEDLTKYGILGAGGVALAANSAEAQERQINLDNLPDREEGLNIDLSTLPDQTTKSEPGNIDLNTRPRVKLSDGTTATVRSMSFGDDDGREVLVPTISDDGRELSDEEAVDLYKKTGKHLGKFTSVEEADEYANQLHLDQEKMIGSDSPKNDSSFLGSLWNKLTSPLVTPGSDIRQATDQFREDNPTIGGALDFVTDVLGGMTSPLNLATGTAFGVGKGLGLPIANRVGQALSIPTAIEGGINLNEGIQEEDPAQMISGGLELGGSLLGMKSALPKRIAEPVEDILTASKPKVRPVKGFEGAWEPVDRPGVILDESGVQIAGPLDERFKSIRPEVDATPQGKYAKVLDVANAAKTLKSSIDLSAPFRQGFGLIGTKSWWTGWSKMVKAGLSEDFYQKTIKEIESHPNFVPEVVNGKVGKSFAEKSGLYLAKLDDITQREEHFASKYAEKVPGVRASGRAYATFLNKLRADNFNNLVDQAQKAGLSPKTDITLSNKIAGFINNASGRGSLGGLEKAAKELNATFFSPRLISSRLKMMNPLTYLAEKDPFIRKQYIKSALTMGSAYLTMIGLAKAGGAEVSLDSQNPNFGKIKFKNTRIDPGAGFLQYAVLASKIANSVGDAAGVPGVEFDTPMGKIPIRMKGGKSSSETGEFREYNSSPIAGTLGDDVVSFVRNKLAPVPKYVSDPFFAKGYNPFHPADDAARLFTPIMLEDLSDLIQSDPEALYGLIPNTFGMGSQNYGKNVEKDMRLLGDWTKQFDISIPRSKK